MKIAALVLLAGAIAVSGCATNSVGGKRLNDGRLTDGQKAASYNAELGTNYLASGSLEQAETKLQRALIQDSGNALANNSNAKLLAALDDNEGAEKHFKKSIRLDEKRAEYRNNYGIFLCDQGRTEEAMEQFITASENKFYETPEFALDNAGVCAIDAAQYELADKHLRAAIRKNPGFAPSTLHMAELKLKTGDALLADAYYERYLGMARHTPQSLLVGIDIRQTLGDSIAVNQFAQKLISAYPQSSQAKIFLASQ